MPGWPPKPWRAARELASLLDELAVVDWRQPSWWAVVGAGAALEQIARQAPPEVAGLTSNGGPRADTFMARALPAALEPAGRIARAVAAARAAVEALDRLDGRFPGQPLRCSLDARASALRRHSLTRPRRVLFATPGGVHAADLDADPAGDHALAASLVAACAGRPVAAGLRRIDPAGDRPLDAAIAVSLFTEEPATARHAHRRCWNAGGGPWLGLAWSAELELVTTCHAVVDGYGHAQIARAVFQTLDRRLAAPTVLEAAARRAGALPLAPAPVLPGASPLGVSSCVLEQPLCFAEALYATACALEQFHRRTWSRSARTAARFTPTLQVPVAPGRRGDPERLRRRVVPGLLAVAMRDGQVEPFERFQQRVPIWLAREAAAAGVLSRLRAAAAHAPLPTGLKQDLMTAGAVPHRWLPPVSILAGRGCLSSLRFPDDERLDEPMLAVSAPALDPAPGDPDGGSVITLVHHAGGCAVTVSGTGLAGSAATASQLLALWRSELDAIRRPARVANPGAARN